MIVRTSVTSVRHWMMIGNDCSRMPYYQPQRDADTEHREHARGNVACRTWCGRSSMTCGTKADRRQQPGDQADGIAENRVHIVESAYVEQCGEAAQGRGLREDHVGRHGRDVCARIAPWLRSARETANARNSRPVAARCRRRCSSPARAPRTTTRFAAAVPRIAQNISTASAHCASVLRQRRRR